MMKPVLARRDRRLVRRLDSDHFMQLVLLAFAATVLGTRALLVLTGFPQVGGSGLHISHALWGGLLLFAGALTPLLFINRAAFTWAALLTGVGAGLFIDEVGKFITADNDYFFPAAVPIAYAIFLLAVLIYLRVRRPRDPGARAQLYAAIELLKSALDHELSARDQAELVARLHAAEARANSSDLERLARGLLELVRTGMVGLAPDRPGIFRRLFARLDTVAERWATEHRLRVVLVAGLAILGSFLLSDLAVIVTIATDLANGVTNHIVDIANRFAHVDISDARDVDFLLVRAGLDVVVGVVLVIGAVLVVAGKPRPGLAFAQIGLLLSLAVVNLLVFYFEQFAAVISALAQGILLYIVSHYQDRYIDGDT